MKSKRFVVDLLDQSNTIITRILVPPDVGAAEWDFGMVPVMLVRIRLETIEDED